MTAPSWDLSVAYQSINDAKIEKDIHTVEQGIDQLNYHSKQGLGEGSTLVAQLQKGIVTNESTIKTLRTILVFANCYASVDSTLAAAKQLIGRATKLNANLQQAYSPYLDKLATAEQSVIEKVLASEVPDIQAQKFAIRLLREKASERLSVEQEQLLSALEVDGKLAWGRMYDNLTGTLKVDVDYGNGEREALAYSQASSELFSGNVDKHEPTWRAIQTAMETHRESFASIVNALAGWRHTEAEKRGISNFLSPSLFDSRISEETLNALIDSARDNKELSQKAARLMAIVRGGETLKPWNVNAAMPSLTNGKTKVYEFDEGIQIIKDAFTSVSPEMADFVDIMVNNGWIDAAPKPNKRQGAYCNKFPVSRTPLVFMTWSGSQKDLITLAHELGHAFHNWVMTDMPLAETYYPMTLAETASVFAENIVRDALLEKAESDLDKLEMLWEELFACEGFMLNIPVRFEFEREFYAKRKESELTADELCELMDTTWKDWYGSVMPESDTYFWASKLHFSIPEVNFYNYPYLFGYLFSKGVYAQREIKGESFYPDYVELLRDTGRMKAEEVVLKHLGMNLEEKAFWQQSIDQVGQKISEFEALLAKINS
ncbi:oligoendopeptidase F [Vibrio nigripulchritudo ATCC 27043]|uniref:M3 family oligoendopeptidase n=1 Tax=Vibrio nigripulchritudo TaxID=28173 RepID=UPI00021C181D|nr:M3 family oligoendopeptidase [Vibrio nigripulchritudo]EGU60529.1 oligoendopeptidase F [Vibrio nigripulchritudo ATCC 27043]